MCCDIVVCFHTIMCCDIVCKVLFYLPLFYLLGVEHSSGTYMIRVGTTTILHPLICVKLKRLYFVGALTNLLAVRNIDISDMCANCDI